MKRYKDYLQPETNEGKLDYLLRSGAALPPAPCSVLRDCLDHLAVTAALVLVIPLWLILMVPLAFVAAMVELIGWLAGIVIRWVTPNTQAEARRDPDL
jgi:hypothetical protein